jgi:HEAT repeat protein
MGWLRDFLTRTPRYQGKNCWQWAEEFRRPDLDRQRCEAAFLAMGPSAVPAVIQFWAEADPWHNREFATEILAKMGTATLPRLIKGYLHHANILVRDSCGVTLQKIGPPALDQLCQTLGGSASTEARVACLMAAFRPSDAPPRNTLLWALVQLGPPAVPALLPILADTAFQVRLLVLDVLRQIATADVCPQLVRVLNDPNPEVARSAVRLLGKFCTPNSQAAQALNQLLAEGKDLAIDAVEPLSRMGESAIPILVLGFKHPKPQVRCAVADALGAICSKSLQTPIAAVPKGVTLPPELEELDRQIAQLDQEKEAAVAQQDFEKAAHLRGQADKLHKKKENITREWREKFNVIEGLDQTALTALTAALADPEEMVRNSAKTALGRLGVAAIPALVEALQSRETRARLAAAEVLKSLGKGARLAVSALIAALDDHDAAVRAMAAAALVKMDSEAVPALLEVLKSSGTEQRIRAASLLGDIGNGAQGAIAGLCAAVTDPTAAVRREAAKTLGRICCNCAVSIPTLIEALTDSDGDVRSSAETALEKFRCHGTQGLDPLAEAAGKHKDARVRATTVKLLARSAPQSQTAIAAIEAAASDHEETVREVAIQSLSEIEAARKAAAASEAMRAAATTSRYCCSQCGRQAKPVPASAAKVLMVTADQLPGLLFQCKSCKRLLCGRCAQRDVGGGMALLDQCPLCGGGLGHVEGADPSQSARLEFGDPGSSSSRRDSQREKLLARLHRIESRLHLQSGRAYAQAKKDIEEIRRQLDRGW